MSTQSGPGRAVTARPAPLLAALIGLVFLCGTVSGILIHRAIGSSEDQVAAPHRIFLEKFSQDFKLSPRQRMELRFILEESDRSKWALLETYLKSLPKATQARYLEAGTLQDRRIPSILDARQRKLYAELIRRDNNPVGEDRR